MPSSVQALKTLMAISPATGHGQRPLAATGGAGRLTSVGAEDLPDGTVLDFGGVEAAPRPPPHNAHAQHRHDPETTQQTFTVKAMRKATESLK